MSTAPPQVPVAAAEAPRSRLAVFSALRHPNYRRYWFGMLVAITGWQVQFVALGWLVYQMTSSPAALGGVGLAQAAPTIVLTLFGGVVADRIDRRKLLMFTQTCTGLALFVQATLVLTGLVEVWHIVAVAMLMGALSAFDQPSRMALIPHLVPRSDLMNAVAMGSMIWQSSRVIGPGIAGLLIANVGIAACFYITTAGMLVMVLALATIKSPPPAPSPGRANALAELTAGVRYVVATPIFAALIGLTFFNSLFGMSYVTLMPVFARDVLEVGSTGYGLLMGVGGVGALAGTLLVAGMGNVKRKGLMLLTGAVLSGALVVAFALSRWAPLSAVLLFLVGGVNSLYMTTANTALQALVPDHLRGRVMGIYSLTWSLLPLGGMVGGAVAALAGAPVAVALGGALVTAMALFVGARLPVVRRLT